MSDPNVTIDVGTYNDLLLTKERHEMLLNHIYDFSGLSRDKKVIAFSNKNLRIMLRIIDPSGYQKAFEALLKESKKQD